MNKKFPERIGYNGDNVWDTRSEKAVRAFYKEMMSMFQGLNTLQRKKYLEMLSNQSGQPLQNTGLNNSLNKNELNLLAMHPLVTIGAHTVTHVRLSALNKHDQELEIFNSKKHLEEILNSKIEIFSYPFGGRNDYTKQTVEIVKKVGFRKAASNYPGQFHRWKDPFQIPRQLVRNWGPAEFKNRLSKFWLNGK